MRRTVAAASLVLALTACGGDRNDAGSDATEPILADDAIGRTVTTELVITLRAPVDLAVRPGDAGLFVVEHDGQVVRIEDGEPAVVLDLRDRFAGHDTEQGLTGLEFSADGRVAWTHGTTPDGATIISEFAVGPDGTIDATSERTFLDVGGPPGAFHNSGDLHRAPDGTLLITLGDGAATIEQADGSERPTADPYRVSHDPSTLRGSILRVRPTPGGEKPYEIPADNPFASGPLVSGDGGTTEGRPEVWAWGLRNPWKIDVDPATGDLWIAEVGNIFVEEINLGRGVDEALGGRAHDFGWSRYEGLLPQTDAPTLHDPPVDPIWSYDHDGTRCAISGGVLARDPLLPSIEGAFVFADFCEATLWVLDPASAIAEPLLGMDGPIQVAGVNGIRIGPAGELYAISWFGEIFRLVPA